MRCFWCCKDFVQLTDDHIVPMSLGGTLAFKVKACCSCQNILSKAEGEVARKSPLAIHALSSPIRPRHPDRLTSGNLQPTYFLVKHPLGGYGETLFSAGEKLYSLSYFETKVVPNEPIEVRVRGSSAEDAQKLLALYRKILKLDQQLGPNQLVGETSGSIDLDDEIASDPEFWPRLVLLPGSRLLFRARSGEEMQACAKVLEVLARSDYQIDPMGWQANIQIVGGTPHKISLSFNPRCVRRIVAKIAYGLFCSLTKGNLGSATDERMRLYILGVESTEAEPVLMPPESKARSTSDKPHFFLFSPLDDKTAAYVELYTFLFRVELGPQAALPAPAGLVCAIDGSEMREMSQEEISSFMMRRGHPDQYSFRESLNL